MADEPLKDRKRITPSGRTEEKDAGTEQIQPDAATPDTETAEDVKADAVMEDRFEATDN